MRKLSLLVACTAIFVSSTAFAGGYGTAGCGLGSVIFGNTAGIVQIFAATTNGTSATQTFGITSGTSNCTGGGAQASIRNFIDANKEVLAKDMARGSGETIKSLASLGGCKNSAAVGTHLQSQYKLFSAAVNTPEFSTTVMKSLGAEKSLGCGLVD